MAKDNIERTVIVLEETEVREALVLAQCNDPREIFRSLQGSSPGKSKLSCEEGVRSRGM